jgi:hypothetical protein
MEEFTVEVSDIIKKMKDKTSETFLRNNVFLSANMTKAAYDSGATVQAIFLRAFRGVAQYKFLLKINTPTEVKKRRTVKLNNIDNIHIRNRMLLFTEQFNYF